MQIRWKNKGFALLLMGALVCGAGVYAAGQTDGWMRASQVQAEETAEKINLNDAEYFTITLKEDAFTYTGSAIVPEVTVVEKVMAEPGDDTPAGDVNDPDGDGATSPDAPVEDGDVSANDLTEDTETSAEEKTWVKDTDYSVVCENNINAGTATVRIAPKDTQKYTGEVVLNFTINKKDIGDLPMEGKDKEYKGRPLNADVNMYYNDIKLKRSEDYRIKDYVNNENVGTASATVKGRGNYTGERTMTFKITPKNLYELKYTPDLSEMTYTYDGTYKTPDVTFTFDILGENNKVAGQKTLVKDVDYTITYADNQKVGMAGVMILGKGNFDGSRVMSFKIRPQGTSLKKLVKGRKKITVKWKKKEKQVTGYVVMCSTKKDFSSGVKKVKVKKNVKKYTFKKLKAKKKYFVRIRTYKKVAGLTYYSDWSDVMKIKTK